MARDTAAAATRSHAATSHDVLPPIRSVDFFRGPLPPINNVQLAPLRSPSAIPHGLAAPPPAPRPAASGGRLRPPPPPLKMPLGLPFTTVPLRLPPSPDLTLAPSRRTAADSGTAFTGSPPRPPARVWVPSNVRNLLAPATLAKADAAARVRAVYEADQARRRVDERRARRTRQAQAATVVHVGGAGVGDA